MRILVALGGNAMTSPDGKAAAGDQIEAVGRAAERIAELTAAGHQVLITHGNGPQVGNLLVKNEIAAAVVPPVPLDWCVAQTQATLGFILMNALERAFGERGMEIRPAALVTRTRVAADDPGFEHPTKPVGRYLPYEEAQPLIEHGQLWEDRGPRGWRRLVASPDPVEVLDAPVAAALLDAGHVVVAAGGGGIPVVREADGSLRGVEAVIDKDLTAALLGALIRADLLVIASDVEAAMLFWGTDQARELRAVGVGELRTYAAAGHFASGSMGPKVEAVCRFVEATGKRAVITSLDRIADAAAGKAGTSVGADPYELPAARDGEDTEYVPTDIEH